MTVRILTGDCREVLKTLPDASVQCCVTSPPYFGLRDYGVDGQIGLEQTPEAFVAELVAVFREVRRVLRDDGTLWLNLGDSYSMSTKGSSGRGEKQVTNAGTLPADRTAGLKPKDLIGIPWRVAFALQADGWYLRQDIIWHKPNPMPESVKDRCTKAHEYLFLLSKSARYHFDAMEIREEGAGRTDLGVMKFGGRIGPEGWRDDGGKKPEDGRNKRSVWTVATRPFSEAHFATFPPALIEPCILAGCPVGGTVLDPFFGAGTTGLVADRLQRNAIGIELNPKYADMASRRITGENPYSRRSHDADRDLAHRRGPARLRISGRRPGERGRETGAGSAAGEMTMTQIVPGDRVIYVPMHAHGDRTHSDCERGKVSSVSADGRTVFVRFDAAVSRLGWDGATAQACYPESLVHESQEKRR